MSKMTFNLLSERKETDYILHYSRLAFVSIRHWLTIGVWWALCHSLFLCALKGTCSVLEVLIDGDYKFSSAPLIVIQRVGEYYAIMSGQQNKKLWMMDADILGHIRNWVCAMSSHLIARFTGVPYHVLTDHCSCLRTARVHLPTM